MNGKSPRTMQSYCSISVGDNLAVNAHVISTDYCFAESVLEFRIVRLTSKAEAEVIVCRPKPIKDNADSDNLKCLKGQEQSSLENDLFGFALGGYSHFGVITEEVLKVEDNFD